MAASGLEGPRRAAKLILARVEQALSAWLDDVLSYCGEVSACLAERREQTSLIARLDGDVVQLVERTVDAERVIAPDLAAMDPVAEPPRGRTPLDLELPASMCLVGAIVLPAAAGYRLREAVDFQLDRLSPITPESIVFDVSIVSRDAARQLVRAAYALVRRDDLDALLARLDACGFEPRMVTARAVIDGTPVVFRFGGAARPRAGRWVVPARPIWAAAAIAGAIASMLAAWLLLDLRLEARQAETEQARIASATAIEVSQRRDALRKIATALADIADRPPIGAVLAIVAARLPDNTYVERIEIKGGQLRLVGLSGAAAPILAELADSGLLSDVVLATPVAIVPDAGRERFDIHARIALSPKGDAPR